MKKVQIYSSPNCVYCKMAKAFLDDHKVAYEEFDVLEFHGFSSYMLIVADYIDWARKNNIAIYIRR